MNINLSGIANPSFVLIEGDWDPRVGLELIQAVDATHVVVVRRDYRAQPLFYLLDRDEAERGLQGRSRAGSIREALNLHERDATMVVPADAVGGLGLERCVIRVEGRLVGFVDRRREAPTAPAAKPEGCHCSDSSGGELVIVDKPTQ
jgi:Ternary complex associated domain 7